LHPRAAAGCHSKAVQSSFKIVPPPRLLVKSELLAAAAEQVEVERLVGLLLVVAIDHVVMVFVVSPGAKVTALLSTPRTALSGPADERPARTVLARITR
jgi:hypothetical protein